MKDFLDFLDKPKDTALVESKESKEREELVKSLYRKVKGKFKYLPVEASKHYIIFGLRPFQMKGMPSITFNFSGGSGKLEVGMSSNSDSTEKTRQLLSNMLLEMNKNWKLIEETLRALQ